MQKMSMLRTGAGRFKSLERGHSETFVLGVLVVLGA